MTEYGLLQEHAEAFLAQVRDASDLTVYPTDPAGPRTVPLDAPPTYVAVYFVADRPLGGRLTMGSTRMRMRAYCHCVGATDAAAAVVSDQLAAAVLDVRLDIPGRSVYPIRHEISRDPTDSEATGTNIATRTEVYRLESDPGVDGS